MTMKTIRISAAVLAAGLAAALPAEAGKTLDTIKQRGRQPGQLYGSGRGRLPRHRGGDSR
jgi:guanyl-specific ribonuclease Sa